MLDHWGCAHSTLLVKRRTFISEVIITIYTFCGLWLLIVSSFSLAINLWEFFWAGVYIVKFQKEFKVASASCLELSTQDDLKT